ncbi:DEAD/DEAH box helicase family protein [Chromohalobacter japonicus]|uniref:DEAD/DEAH box helicase family protein n=1 Tax=Chromohalobacter japonicus TaxID=223900 RepID=UPI003F90DB14
MELKLYNRLKRELLGEFAVRAEGHDRDYQKQVESFASRQSSGLPKPMGRKIQAWLDDYNRLLSRPLSLRYYQILALYFTEHVLEKKRAGKGYTQQKALAYWMATGSGKTLLMHLNVLQYIDHIGGGAAFDELQIILTTPGVNLIEQHERELGDVVRHLNRLYNNRIKLTVATTGALLNKEPGFFNMPDSTRLFRLVLVDEGHIGLASGGKEVGAFKQLRQDLLKPDNAFLFEYSATYHGIADTHVRDYEEQIVYDYNYYRFFKDGYGKDYALQSLADDRFADTGKSDAAFFASTFDTLREKLTAHERLSVSQAQGAGELPFAGHFPDKPLLAYMGNTVEDPKKEGSTKDEVSDIRRFVIWLAHLDAAEREAYAPIFNDQHGGKLTLTRSPGVADEIWLSWGDGQYWGLINVGSGDKFFKACEAHPQLHNTNGEPRVILNKAAIVNARYHFDAIDDVGSPINVLVGSRKFAEGWNCFRVSVIGLINLGSSKGNKIIQIFGRGVRLKGLRGDGKRRHSEHGTDYAALVNHDTPDNQLRRLETLNVYSLNKSWLEVFLNALEKDLPAIAGPYSLEVKPAVVQVGTRKQKRAPQVFTEYQHKLHTFKVGRSEFDAPLRITLDAATHEWHWQYCQRGGARDDVVGGRLANPGFSLDYRADRTQPGHNLVADLKACLGSQSAFVFADRLRTHLRVWSRQQRVQLYTDHQGTVRPLDLAALLEPTREVLYDQPLSERGWPVIERLLAEVQRDLLEKVFHKVRYDIDRRQYRFETVRQSAPGARGDFIDRYSLTYEFANQEKKVAFENDASLNQQIQLDLSEPRGDYHIYEPLLGEATETLLKKHKLERIGISPDSLNTGERKFLRDILTFIDTNYSRDHREFYLMRNVESLRSIGLYLEGESRVFYPDFALWIVDDKANKTTLALFDPKGQTGIVKEDDLGLTGDTGMNDKVRVATSGQLVELAKQLQGQTGRQWSLHSFILLRDKSTLGRWKGSAPTDQEMELAEAMIKRGVLRLDWHATNESNQRSAPLRDGDSYLSRIFARLLV